MIQLIFIFSSFICFSVTSCNKGKDTIDVCSLLSKKPSVMAFHIPSKRCIPDSNSLKFVDDQIDKIFVSNARIIDVTSFKVNNYYFVERVYQSRLCDTVAVLFVVKKGEKPLYSKGYKINDNNPDFRISEGKNEIILYRKIQNKAKETTVSFEVKKSIFKIDAFIDDGLSIW